MKKFIAACILSLASLRALCGATEEPQPAPVPPGPFDLQTCFELAVLRSETLGMKEEDIRAAQAKYWQTVGSVLPKAHVLASETLQNPNSQGGAGAVVGDNNTGGGDFFGGSGGRSDRFQSRLNVKQPIFSGFREFHGAAAGRAEIEARKLDKQRRHQLLYLDVTDVFYQILAYEGDLLLLADVKHALEERLQELDQRLRLGKSRKSEWLSAQVDLSKTMATMEQVRGLLGASRELMAFLTGVPSARLQLKDEQPLPGPDALEAYLIQASERPDVLSAVQMERSSRKRLSAAKGEHWPTLAFEGNYYLKEIPASGRDWNIFLTFDLPLFEGGIIEAKVREQKALLRSSELNLRELQRAADKEVRTAYNNFIAAAAQVVRLRATKTSAEANFQAQSEDYALGVVNNLDVLEALRQLHETRRQLLDLEMETRVNLVRLHVAAGQAEPPKAKP